MTVNHIATLHARRFTPEHTRPTGCAARPEQFKVIEVTFRHDGVTYAYPGLTSTVLRGGTGSGGIWNDLTIVSYFYPAEPADVDKQAAGSKTDSKDREAPSYFNGR